MAILTYLILSIRFLLELALLVAVGVGAYHVGGSSFIKYGFAILAPLLVACVEAVQVAGEYEKVFAMDIVCLDPQKDVAMATVKTGVHVMLSFLTGKMVAASGK